VTARDIRRYALAIDDPNPIYYDENAAKKGKYGGFVAPPGFVYWATHGENLDMRAKDLEVDGLTPGAFLGIPEIPNIWSLGWVRGGEELEFVEPLRVGDRVSVTCKLLNVYEKEGKSGKLVFLNSEHVYRNQKGELLAKQQLTFIGMPRKEK
jgi:acyl dehydratase